MKNQFMTPDKEKRGEAIRFESDLPIDFSIKERDKPKEKVLAVLKFMKKLSDFEKRSAEKNFLVGRKK